MGKPTWGSKMSGRRLGRQYGGKAEFTFRQESPWVKIDIRFPVKNSLSVPDDVGASRPAPDARIKTSGRYKRSLI